MALARAAVDAGSAKEKPCLALAREAVDAGHRCRLVPVGKMPCLAPVRMPAAAVVEAAAGCRLGPGRRLAGERVCCEGGRAQPAWLRPLTRLPGFQSGTRSAWFRPGARS